MYVWILTIVLCIIPLNYGTLLLPSIFWDPDNPILQKQFWSQVTPVRIYDTLTFVCPNDRIQFRSISSRTAVNKYNNLYMKEIPADITNFDDVCDTSENSTFFIANCDKVKSLISHDVEINVNTADPDTPRVQQGRHYMFFATSRGTKRSLDTSSKKCTLVFRIQVYPLDATISNSCPLYGRENVCERFSRHNSKGCEGIIPQNVSLTATGDSVTITWQPPPNLSCNITHYTVCHQKSAVEPCKENSVPAKQHSLTISGLTADQMYIIKVRAHTANGPGKYCDKIRYEKGLEFSGQKDEGPANFDGKSIAIGLFIGIVTTLIVVAAVWLGYTRLCRKKVDCCEDEKDVSRNNPNFYKASDESMNNVLKLGNNGYRESVQGFQLPPVTEENLHLCVSDA